MKRPICTDNITPFVPTNLAKRWKPVKTEMPNISVFTDSKTDMAVVSSLETMENEKTYIHLEIFHNLRRPDWDEVMTAKNAFIGKERSAFILLDDTKKDNIDKYSINVWSVVDNGNS